ncbi:MAG: prepilin-type N-terminal cleavage/methylation domain-containing protein [Planctomycetes bacterium]|nr:prepilin-type N-terminal cleavage/methylation domain-containing protein [Planctomycetota bacterium]
MQPRGTSRNAPMRPKVYAVGQEGFSLVELMVVMMIIGLMTYTVSMSFDSMVPGERLNTSVRELAGDIREARRDATTRNLEFFIEYDLDENRYRTISPFVRGGGMFIPGIHREEERLLSHWQPLKEGITLERVSVAGVDQDRGHAIVRFDPSGAASAHYVVLGQPRFEKLFTVEVMALTGLIRFHDGLFERDLPEDADFE